MLREKHSPESSGGCLFVGLDLATEVYLAPEKKVSECNEAIEEIYGIALGLDRWMGYSDVAVDCLEVGS